MNAGNPVQHLVDECFRQEENCRYTATSFTIWLRWLRAFRLMCEIAPIVFGALATWKIVAQTSPVSGAVFALLATVIPPVYRASKTDKAIDQYSAAAGEFTNLRDRFRQAALIYSHEDFSALESHVRPLFDRLEKVRRLTLTPPDIFFLLSRRKNKAGHYFHDFDETKGQAPSRGD